MDWWTGIKSALSRALTIPEGGIDTVIAEIKLGIQKVEDVAQKIAHWFVADAPTIISTLENAILIATKLTGAGFVVDPTIIADAQKVLSVFKNAFDAVEAAEGVSAAQSIAAVGIVGGTAEQMFTVYGIKRDAQRKLTALQVAIANAHKRAA